MLSLRIPDLSEAPNSALQYRFPPARNDVFHASLNAKRARTARRLGPLFTVPHCYR